MTKTSLSQKRYELRRTFRAWKRHATSTIQGRPVIKELDGAVDTRTIPEEFRKRMETNYNAFKTYEPGTFSGNIVLFRARMRPLLHGFTPDLNWGEVATGILEVINIPGNHGTILQRPNINILAKQLRTLLDME
jgi:thioesterase domain-containing protein